MESNFKIIQNLPPDTADIVEGYRTSGAESFAVFTAFEVSGVHPALAEASAHRAEQKRAFLADEIENPVLNYCPNFELLRQNRRDAYRAARALLNIQDLRYGYGVRPTTDDRMLDIMITSSVNQLGYVETAAAVAMGNLDTPGRTAAASILKQAGREIYRMPDHTLTMQMLQAKRAKAQVVLPQTNNPLHADADYVTRNLDLPGNQPEAEAFPEMETTTLDWYYEIMEAECQESIDYAFEETGIKVSYTPQEIVAIYQRYLEHRGYTASGWRANLVPNRTTCATSRQNMALEVGDKRPTALLEYKPVVKSLLHEGEVHIGRAHRWSQADTALAGLSLPGSADFEEGFAGTIQNLYFKEQKQQGEQFVTALGISGGYDGCERNFRDSFELMWRLQLLQDYKTGITYADQAAAKRLQVYGNLLRVWRGMPTDIPGCVFPKDAQYDNGSVTNYLANDGRPLPRADFLRLLDAKFTPFDPNQTKLVAAVSTRRALGNIAST